MLTARESGTKRLAGNCKQTKLSRPKLAGLQLLQLVRLQPAEEACVQHYAWGFRCAGLNHKMKLSGAYQLSAKAAADRLQLQSFGLFGCINFH